MNRALGYGIVGCLALSPPAASAGATGADLAAAVKAQDIPTVRALLKQKVDVNVPQADGATALHWAAYKNDLDTLGLLLSAGARVNVANVYGVTPLSLA